jgi:hypothetical protein
MRRRQQSIGPALSQQTSGDQSPAISTMSGNVTVTYTNTGLAPEQLAKLIIDVTGKANADAAEVRQQLDDLQRRLGVTEVFSTSSS